MLEPLRKYSRSWAIYGLFLFLIVVFVISFGPQSRGVSCETTMANDHYAAMVAGDTVSNTDFRYGLLLYRVPEAPVKMAREQRIKEAILDRLIERELLAQQAEKMGYVVTEDQVEDMIGDAKMIGLGELQRAPYMQKEGRFNYDSFKMFAMKLGMTPKAFVEEERKEMLASHMRDLLRSGVTVSPNEVKADFERKNRQVNLEYVTFAPRRYAAQSTPTEAEVATYLKTGEAKLRAVYAQRKLVYDKSPKQLKLQELVVKGADADKKGEALAARAKKGEPFDKLARDDAATTSTAWKGRGATKLPADAEEKLFAGKAGDVVGPLKGNDGASYIYKIEASREGDLSFEQVKQELAEEQLVQQKAEARAKSDAEAALAKAKAGPEKTLKDLFPPPADDKAEAAGAGDSTAPRAEETGLFSPRAGRDGVVVEGIGISTPLAKAAFELTPQAPLAGPFQIAGAYVVVRLKQRTDPDPAEWTKKKDELVRDAERHKQVRVVSDWTQARCQELKSAKKIQVNTEVLKYEDSAAPPPYEPCLPRFPGGMGG
jgi:peptidyl-prolyl cis-trans isomerase D